MHKIYTAQHIWISERETLVFAFGIAGLSSITSPNDKSRIYALQLGMLTGIFTDVSHALVKYALRLLLSSVPYAYS